MSEEKRIGREIPGMFDGNVFRLIIKMAMPIYLGMLFQLLYNITDTIWVSRIDMHDPSYVGATGMVFPIFFFGMALSNGLMVGISSLVARAIGERNYRILDRTAESGFAIAAVMALVILVFGYAFTEKLVALLGAEGDYFVHGVEYLHYILPAMALWFIVYVFAGILQGEGLMKHIMAAMMIGTVANIVLDPVFIFLLKMDIRGAALATTLSQLFPLVYVVQLFLRKKTAVTIHWKFSNISVSVIGSILAIGMPQALSQIAMSLSAFFFNRLLIMLDPLALTAFSLVGRFDQVVLMPSFALSSAMVTIVGQNVGRRLFDRVREAWHKGVLLGIGVVLALATVMVLIAPLLYRGFSKVPEVIAYAVRQTRIMEFTFIFAIFGILGRAVFQGSGTPLPALVITILRTLMLAVPTAWLYVYVFDFGVIGVYLGMITGNSLTAVVSWVWAERNIRALASGRRQVGLGKT